MNRLIFVILAVVVGCCLADVSSGTITLGISLTTTPAGSTRALQGTNILNGLNLWLDTINATSASIRGQNYRFELKVLEDDGTLNKITSNYQQLMNDSSVDFLLGPVGSEMSNPISILTNSSQRLLVGTSVGSVDFYNGMQYSFSVVPAATRCPSVSYPYFRLKGSTKIALMISQARNPKEACSGINDETSGAAANGLEIVASYQINSSLGNISEYAQAQIEDMVTDLKTKQVDAVIGCAFGDTGALIMEQFKTQDFAPKFVTFLPFDTQYSAIDTQLSDFITGCSRFEAGANFVKDPVFGGTQKFVQAYQAKYGATPDDYAAFGAMAGILYQISIQSADSFSQDAVRDSMERFNEDTFMGQVFFGVDHSNQMSCLYVQMVNGSRMVVGPPLAQLTSFDIIDPFPTWEERTFERKFNVYEAEWVFFSLALLGNAFSLGLLIYVIVARDTPIIKASSPNLLIIFLIGSMFLYSSIFTWTLSNVSAASCYIQSWILSFGWTIMFGALIAKSWRVYKLSSNKSLQIFKITDAQLVFIILGLLAGNIIICAVQAGVVDMNPTRIHVDEYRPIYDYEQCPEGGAVVGIAASLIAYNGVLCVAGLIIAWKIRKLRYSVYNESKIIAFSMYNAAFFAILVIVLQFTKATERELLYILRSAGIMLGTAVSVATLFVTKLTMDREKHSSSFKSAGAVTSSNYGNSSYNNQSYNQSYASTDALRANDLQKKLEAKEEELMQLKKKKSAPTSNDAQYYQNKYEQLYSENQVLKNEMFKLKDLLEKNNRRQNSPQTPSSYQPTSSSSEDNVAN